MSLKLLPLRLLSLRLPLKTLQIHFASSSASGRVCQDWRPPRTIAEPLQTVAHHFPPKLPPFAMLATFATFAVAFKNFHPRRVYGLRTQLPPGRTRQPTHLVLVASMLQQHLSYIRPQRLYKPALRPS